MAALSRADYLRLIKPGIIMGNGLHYVIGVLIAVPAMPSDWMSAAVGLVATTLLIASACMVNNWLDRDYDQAMKRTLKRATARGDVSLGQIVAMSTILGLLGVGLLLVFVNSLTAGLGVIAWLTYSFVYTLSKPRTVHSTLIGTVPGALPAVAGYAAVSGALDLTAMLIGLLIVVWQLPHFYAIAIYRQREYRAAGLPVLSTRLSPRSMYLVVVSGLVGFLISAVMVAYLSLHWLAGAVLVAAAVSWLYQASSYRRLGHEQWARKIFVWSMYVSLGMMVAAIVHFAFVTLT